MWVPARHIYTPYFCATADPLPPPIFARCVRLVFPLAEPCLRRDPGNGGRLARGYVYLTVRDDAPPAIRAWVRRTPDKPGPKAKESK